MPDSILNAFPSAATLDGSEILYTVQGGADRKVSAAQIKAYTEAGERTELIANATYYVSSAGSDTTGDGSLGNPWLTPQHAIDFISTQIDMGGFTVTIKLVAGAPNTYPGCNFTSFIGGGSIYIESTDGNVDNTIISQTGNPAIWCGTDSNVDIHIGGMTLESTENCILAEANITISIGTTTCPNIKLGQCGNGFSQIRIHDHATFRCTAGGIITIAPQASGAFAFFECGGGALGYFDGFVTDYVISGNPAYTNFVSIYDGGSAYVNIITGVNLTGTCTGPKFKTIGLSAIGVDTGHAVSLIPGDSDGRLNSSIIKDSTGDTLDVGQVPVPVSSLPTSSNHLGHRRMVSDASAPTFGAVVSGSSSTVIPVYCDGTNWRVG